VRIILADSANSETFGAWFNPDPIDVAAMIAGAPASFLHDSTSSDSAESLYDLTPPPSFSGPPMTWGRIDQDGALRLFLAATTGDEGVPFATLENFAAGLNGSGSPGGSGDLFRSNRLPPAIQWQVSP
jgi:hypothetical protein